MKKFFMVLVVLFTSMVILSSLNLNVNLGGDFSNKSQLFGLALGLQQPITNPFFLECGVGIKMEIIDWSLSNLSGFYFAPDILAGINFNLFNLNFLAGLKYEPLIAFSPFIFNHRMAFELGLSGPFRLLGKIGWDFAEFSPYFGVTVGFSFPLSFGGSVTESTKRLQDYGIDPKTLSMIVFTTDRTEQIRCGESSLNGKIKVSELNVLEKIFKDKRKIKLYIGFSEDWNIQKNGFVEITLEGTNRSYITINGAALKTIPEKVFRSEEQKVYILGYQINNLVLDDFKKPLETVKSNVKLRIIPGHDVVLMQAKDKDGKDILPEPVYADRYAVREIVVKDIFGNQFKLVGDYQLNLTKAGKNIDLGTLEGVYENTKIKVDVRLKAQEVVPNYDKIGEFRAKFNSNQVLVGETVELTVLTLKDIYGNDIKGITIKNIIDEENRKFEAARITSNGREFIANQIGIGKNWNVEIEVAGRTLNLKFQDELKVLPNLKKVSVSISEQMIGILPELIANENGKISISPRPIKLTDNFNNEIEVRRINLSGKEGKLELDFSKSTLIYNLTKAQQLFEKDFTDKKIVIYIPKLNIEQTVDSSQLGLFSFNIPVTIKPNVPVRLVLDNIGNSIVLPTYYNETSRFEREYNYQVFDRYGNKASGSEVKFVSQIKELEKIFTVSQGKLKITNYDVRKPGVYTVSVENIQGTELQKLRVEVIPLLRVIELEKFESGKEIESLGYNVYKIKLKAHDGNGNSYNGSYRIRINDTLEEIINFKNGVAELEFSSASYGLGSVKAVIEPVLADIGHKESKKEIELIGSFISLGKINPSILTFERQINDEKARENAYGPAVSLTGNYVAYFVVKQDGTPGFIVSDLRSGKQEDILTQISSTKRRSGQSSSEIKQETVYSYTWVPMRDILIYTPMVSNSFDIYAYIPETKQKVELFKNGKNNTDITFDYTGKIAIWVSGGVVMKANADYSENIRFVNPTELIKLNQVIIQPNISPNGKYVAFIAETDVYLYDIASKRQMRLTNDISSEFELSWSPDSNYLAYYKKVGNTYSLYLMDLRNIENGKTPQEYQIYKDIAYDFGKPVWISSDEVSFAANDVSSSLEAISVYELSSNKVKRIKIVQDFGAAFTFLNILPVQREGKYTLKAIYGGFTGREGVFFGQLK